MALAGLEQTDLTLRGPPVTGIKGMDHLYFQAVESGALELWPAFHQKNWQHWFSHIGYGGAHEGGEGEGRWAHRGISWYLLWQGLVCLPAAVVGPSDPGLHGGWKEGRGR